MLTNICCPVWKFISFTTVCLLVFIGVFIAEAVQGIVVEGTLLQIELKSLILIYVYTICRGEEKICSMLINTEIHEKITSLFVKMQVAHKIQINAKHRKVTFKKVLVLLKRFFVLVLFFFQLQFTM